MKYTITINNILNVDEIIEYWTKTDYINLLEKFNFPDAKSIKEENLREMLFMAISDYEPNEAAKVVLEYKLSDHLNEGQIDQISNEMLIDKVSEEYPEIPLQETLYHINQLLYKAYNGTFLNSKASIITISIKPESTDSSIISKEVALKLLNKGLSDSCVIKRLFNDQLNDDDMSFDDAEHILWTLETTDNVNYKIITSEYWLSREDFIASEFETEFSPSAD
jgi:hypothetical protein